MVSNTRSVIVGLILSAAQLSSASPAASADTAFSSPIYPTATDSIPARPSSTDACLAKCNAAHDKCSTAPDANHATCAAEYAECIGYNPYGGASYVEPTACSHSSKPTATETAKAGDCLEKCNKAHDACNVAPDANHATCAAEWAECLGYNPYDGPGGSLVEPTACAAHTTMASATGKHTGMETSKPTGTEASKPAKTSEPVVVVNGAGSLSGKVAGFAGAIGAAVVALL
ncbi:cell wall glycoprotein [Fusarium mexicanum]|uniref:Cell wall glycoprotein n=1 Tax=Fusarium mexicanum TaxID=751941 RepID=A0A8H5MTG3_9HYPO|nr:cell wall glycoprotein [Fusarium mexicanum]